MFGSAAICISGIEEFIDSETGARMKKIIVG
jgi:hypothetical protein